MVVEAICSGKHREVALQTFAGLDTLRRGMLDWNSGKIRDFILQVFRRLQIAKEPQDTEMYSMYCTFDTGGKWGLDSSDCIKLIEALCRSLYRIQDNVHFARAVLAIDDGRLAEVVRRTFNSIVPSCSGTISWNGGGIRRFTTELFRAFDLAIPSEQYTFAMCSAFHVDVDGERCLGLHECQRLGEALFRTLDQIST